MRWDERLVMTVRSRVLMPDRPSVSAQARALDRIVEKLEIFGGHVEMAGQTGATAVFGQVPPAQAARRAAMAALAIVTAIERDQGSGITPPPLIVGVGLHAERVLVTSFRGMLKVEEGDRRALDGVLDALEPLVAGRVTVSDGAARLLADRFTLRRRADAGAGHLIEGPAAARPASGG